MKKHILLLHGALGCAEQLQPLADVLRNEYEVHLLNFSGHGGKPFPERFSIELFADEIIQYRQTIISDEVYVFGYSMGGYVALYVSLIAPTAFKKIITLATKFDWTPQSAQKEVQLLHPETIAMKVPKYAAQLAQHFAPHDWKQALPLTADLMLSLGAHPLVTTETVSSINTPVCVGVGDKDTMVSLDETLSIYKALPKGSLYVLPDTPHPVERVNVKMMAALINEYMNKPEMSTAKP